MIHRDIPCAVAALTVQLVEALCTRLDDVTDNGVAHHGEHNLRRDVRGAAADDKVVPLVPDEHTRRIGPLQRVQNPLRLRSTSSFQRIASPLLIPLGLSIRQSSLIPKSYISGKTLQPSK